MPKYGTSKYGTNNTLRAAFKSWQNPTKHIIQWMQAPYKTLYENVEDILIVARLTFNIYRRQYTWSSQASCARR